MFSVVIPCYNSESTIRRAVESVLRQTFADFEVIVVDDGSTDASIARLAEVSDPRLRVVSQNNQGPAEARNAGVALANELYVAFLDGDDEWDSRHLACLAILIASYPTSGLFGMGFRVAGASPISSEARFEMGPVDYLAEVSRGRYPFCTSSVAIPTHLFREIGGFRQFRFGQDVETWVRIVARETAVCWSLQTAVYYDQTPNNSLAIRGPQFYYPGKSLSPSADTLHQLLTSGDLPARLVRSGRAFIARQMTRRISLAIRSENMTQMLDDVADFVQYLPLSTRIKLLMAREIPAQVRLAIFSARDDFAKLRASIKLRRTNMTTGTSELK